MCRFNDSNLSKKHILSYIQQAHLDYLHETKRKTDDKLKQETQSSTTKDNINFCQITNIPDQSLNSMDIDMKSEDETLSSETQKIQIVKTVQKVQTASEISQDSKIKHNKIKTFLYSSDEEEISVNQKEYAGLIIAVDNFEKCNSSRSIESEESLFTCRSNIENMDVCEPEISDSQNVTEHKPVVTASKNNFAHDKEKSLTNRKISDYFKPLSK